MNVRSLKKCEVCGKDYKGTIIQKYCSNPCQQISCRKQQKHFNNKNPDAMVQYNKNRVKRNPDVWRQKSKKDREDIISMLGGVCAVDKCNITKKEWLHADYIPTMNGTGLRHPRHKRWVLDHLEDFRLLCANHHYELTITGSIEGSNITQNKKKENDSEKVFD